MLERTTMNVIRGGYSVGAQAFHAIGRVGLVMGLASGLFLLLGEDVHTLCVASWLVALPFLTASTLWGRHSFKTEGEWRLAADASHQRWLAVTASRKRLALAVTARQEHLAGTPTAHETFTQSLLRKRNS